jgi:succinate---hydroxymethylglutarate CoA-transferase
MGGKTSTTSFISQTVAWLKATSQDCKQINPRLIYTSITGQISCPLCQLAPHLFPGYGQTGPYRQAAGYDVVIEAEAGLMHMFAFRLHPFTGLVRINVFSTGEPDRPPVKAGVACTDIWTGLYAHGAIMAAILSREKTGKGVWIDCNLFESQVRGPYRHSAHLILKKTLKKTRGL